jgi:hypothetical protein
LGGRDPGEPEEVVSRDLFDVAGENTAERDVDAEPGTVHLAGEPALGPESVTVVLDAVASDLGRVGIRRHLELHEVAQVEGAC